MRRRERIAARAEWLIRPDRMIEASRPPPDPNLEAVYLARGLILIHIPKNAGTSVEAALYGYPVRHRTAADLRRTCPRAWAVLPKIAVLRDPVDRFLSAYDYMRAGGRNRIDRTFGMLLIGTRPLPALVARLQADPVFRRRAMGFFHFRPQADYVCDGAEIAVDHLVPMERMAQDLTRLADLPPGALAHKNRSTGPRTDPQALPQATVAAIRQLYARDGDLHARALAAPTSDPIRPQAALTR